ncbi:MAG: small subunit ribosomal protein S6 [Parcubacteria group bacterium Licking1014_1]|nr:MAG: small subunit ribosomal protein S6 [Parcubacteria group bacterium Licking1014_1]
MKTYELAYIISQELTSKEAEIIVKEIESFIQSREGTILKRKNPSAKILSYPIKKQSSGFFGVLGFQLEPEKLNELEKIVKKEVKIIRHMLTIENPAKKVKIRKEKRRLELDAGIEKISIAQNINNKSEKIELKDIGEKLDEILRE